MNIVPLTEYDLPSALRLAGQVFSFTDLHQHALKASLNPDFVPVRQDMGDFFSVFPISSMAFGRE